MITLSQLVTIFLTAAVLQNALFSRGLGSGKDTLTLAPGRNILWFGCFLTVFTCLSALVSYPVYLLMRVRTADQTQTNARSVYFLTTLICMCAIFALITGVTRFFFPKVYYHLRPLTLPLLFNCAAFGSVLIALRSGYSLLHTLVFCVGAGFGYTGALLLVSEARRRLSLSDVPRAFRGLPIMMLYIGLFSLAIYGLIGHLLPT